MTPSGTRSASFFLQRSALAFDFGGELGQSGLGVVAEATGGEIEFRGIHHGGQVRALPFFRFPVKEGVAYSVFRVSVATAADRCFDERLLAGSQFHFHEHRFSVLRHVPVSRESVVENNS